MFLLLHALHVTGPLAIVLMVAMIALRLWFRAHRRSRR
jgi:hypothetical protein